MGGCLRVCQKCPFLVSFNFSADFLCTILGLYWTTLGLCSVLFCSALSERVWGGVEQRSLSRYLIAIICVLDQHCWWRDGDWPRWSALPVVCRVKMWSTMEKERAEPIFSKKSWVSRGDQDGGSGGHLLGSRQGQVREEATGDLKDFLIKFPSKAFTPSVKVKVFWPISRYFCFTCSVLDKDPLGLKVLERYVQYQIQK